MPLPTPRDEEEQSAFINRCMGDELMNSEYPDQKQRVAVCYSQWRRRKEGEVFHYFARLHSPFAVDGKWYALLRVITAETSRPSEPKGERWRPSYESLKKYLSTFMDAPLIGPPCPRECRGDACLTCGHYAVTKMGHPVSFSMPDGYGEIVYELTHPDAIVNVQSGEWHDVSPQLRAWRLHMEDDDVHVLDDWAAEHVAFVDKGAFRDVEVVDWWQGRPDRIYTLAAELFHGHPETARLEPGGLMTDGAATLPDRGRQAADQIKNRRFGDSLSDRSQTFTGADAWDTADAPDDAFAYVPESAKGPDGNKSERKFPLYSIAKKGPDEAIVRNALARFPQANLPADAKMGVLRKICSYAKRLDIESELCQEQVGGEGCGCDKTGEGAMSTEGKDKEGSKPSGGATKEETENEKVLKAELQRVQGELDNVKKALVIAEKRAEAAENQPTSRAYQAEHERMKARLQELEQKEQEREAEAHMAMVRDVVDVRTEAGFADANDRPNEILRVKEFNTAALEQMKADAVAVILERESSLSPKAHFVGAKKPDNEAAHRIRMGLPRVEEKQQ